VSCHQGDFICLYIIENNSNLSFYELQSSLSCSKSSSNQTWGQISSTISVAKNKSSVFYFLSRYMNTQKYWSIRAESVKWMLCAVVTKPVLKRQLWVVRHVCKSERDFFTLQLFLKTLAELSDPPNLGHFEISLFLLFHIYNI